jgi:hypothetical protein
MQKRKRSGDTMTDDRLKALFRERVRVDRLSILKEAPISKFPYVCMKCPWLCVFENKTLENVIEARFTKCTLSPKNIRKHLKRRDANEASLEQ